MKLAILVSRRLWCALWAELNVLQTCIPACIWPAASRGGGQVESRCVTELWTFTGSETLTQHCVFIANHQNDQLDLMFRGGRTRTEFWPAVRSTGTQRSNTAGVKTTCWMVTSLLTQLVCRSQTPAKSFCLTVWWDSVCLSPPPPLWLAERGMTQPHEVMMCFHHTCRTDLPVSLRCSGLSLRCSGLSLSLQPPLPPPLRLWESLGSMLTLALLAEAKLLLATSLPGVVRSSCFVSGFSNLKPHLTFHFDSSCSQQTLSRYTGVSMLSQLDCVCVCVCVCCDTHFFY